MVSVSNKFLKTCLSVYFKPSKQFTSNWSQTFANYSSMPGTPLTIAPFRADGYSQCYGSLKNLSFCPRIVNFTSTDTFLRKTKVIFEISSSSCIGPYVVKAVFLKKKFWPVCRDSLEKKSSPFFVSKKHLSEKPRRYLESASKTASNGVQHNMLSKKNFFRKFWLGSPTGVFGQKNCFFEKSFISFKMIF